MSDLNARLGTLCTIHDCVGPYTTPIRRSTSTHITHLLEFWDRHDYTITNSFHKPPNIDESVDPSSIQAQLAVSTWRSPSHEARPQPFQIDFIVTNAAARHKTTDVYPMEWGEFCAIRKSDHRPLLLKFTSTSPATPKRYSKRIHKRFINDEHRDQFIAKLTALHHDYKLMTMYTSMTSQETLAQVELIAQHCLQATAPPATVTPRKPWLTDATAQQMFIANRYRK
eukprot:3029784-Amphidinium_carterae.1